MIIDDQIAALAREYAEEVYRNAHKEMEVLPNCLSTEAINMFAEDMEHKLQWLLRRFCLVDKSKMVELEIARRTKENGAVWLTPVEVYTLFPGIAAALELIEKKGE